MKKSIAEIHDELYMHLRTNYPDVRFGVNGLFAREKWCEGYWFESTKSGILTLFWGDVNMLPNHDFEWSIYRNTEDNQSEDLSLFSMNLSFAKNKGYTEKLVIF